MKNSRGVNNNNNDNNNNDNVLADHRPKLKESEKRDKCQDSARKLKTIEHEGDGDTIYNWCTWANPQRIVKETGKFVNNETNGDLPDYGIIKISQNSEKSPGHLRRLAVA